MRTYSENSVPGSSIENMNHVNDESEGEASTSLLQLHQPRISPKSKGLQENGTKHKVSRGQKVSEISSSEDESRSDYEEPGHYLQKNEVSGETLNMQIHHPHQNQQNHEWCLENREPDSPSQQTQNSVEKIQMHTSHLKQQVQRKQMSKSKGETELEEESDSEEESSDSGEARPSPSEETKSAEVSNPFPDTHVVSEQITESEFEEHSNIHPIRHSENIKHELSSPVSPVQDTMSCLNEQNDLNNSTSMRITQEINDEYVPPSVQLQINTSTFEEEHLPVSAPVVDIPLSSRVWLLQVPRNMPAANLLGQHFPKKIKGTEILNLASGHWEISEKPFDSYLPCVIPSGHLSYKMECIKPKAFRILKMISSPISFSSPEISLREDPKPLPIETLLKMKRRKSVLPHNQTNIEIYEGNHLNGQNKRKQAWDDELPKKKKRKGAEKELVNFQTSSSGECMQTLSDEKLIKLGDVLLDPIDKKDKNKKKKSRKSCDSNNEPTSFAQSIVKHEVNSDFDVNCDMKQQEEVIHKRNKKRKCEEIESGICDVTTNVGFRNGASKGEKTINERQKRNVLKDTFQESDMLKGKHFKTESPDQLQSVENTEIKRKKCHSKKKEENIRASEEHFSKEEVAIDRQRPVKNHEVSFSNKRRKKHKHEYDRTGRLKEKTSDDILEGESSPDGLRNSYLTQIAPDDV